MAILRHEKQQYATPAALTAETIAPTNNDSTYVESLRRTFDWIEGSSLVADDLYVINQTSEAANGRWVTASAANVYTGTATTDDMSNGQISVIDVTVTNADPAKANVVAVTNADTFEDNVFVTSKEVVAVDTVRVTIENQSGLDVTGFAVNLTVLEF